MRHAREDYNRIQDPENKIPADEPVFLLRAQDPFAAEAVRLYAHLLAANARNGSVGADVAFSSLALRHAAKMEEWPTKKAYPDAPGVNETD
jgi:hypothetical protein